jgi:tetratricopeptide (TPR) repeat protein
MPRRGGLLPVAPVQPKQAMIHYDLARYECQLGNLESAKRYLQDAFQLNPTLQMAALERARIWSRCGILFNPNSEVGVKNSG